MDAGAAAELAHRLAHRRLDERVDHHRRAAAGLLRPRCGDRRRSRTRGCRTPRTACSGNCASSASTSRAAVSPVESETMCSSTGTCVSAATRAKGIGLRNAHLLDYRRVATARASRLPRRRRGRRAERIAGVAVRTPLLRLPLQRRRLRQAREPAADRLVQVPRCVQRPRIDTARADRAEVSSRTRAATTHRVLRPPPHSTGFPATIVMPGNAARVKVERTAAWGAEIARSEQLERRAAAAWPPRSVVRAGSSTCRPSTTRGHRRPGHCRARARRPTLGRECAPSSSASAAAG